MSEARQKFELINPNSPTDLDNSKAVRIDQVVDTKESLANAAEALKDGKMPTTSQITEAIDTVRDAKLREGVELSSTGQRVTDKLDQVLDSTKRLVKDKNKDNEIQKLIHHSKLASINLETEVDSKDSQKVLQKAYSNLVVLAQLIVTSGEFRALLGDFYNLLRDVLQENNVPGANKLPSAEEMTTKDGKIDKNKVNEVSKEVTQDAKKATQDMAEQKKDQVYSQMSQEDRRKLEKVQDGNHNQLADEMINMAIQNVGQAIKPMVDKASEGNTEEAKREGKEIAQDTKAQAKDYSNEASGHATKIKNQIQSQANQTMNQANEVISNISLNDEQLEKLADRLSGIVDEVQSHPDYQRALEGLFDVVHNIKRNAETAANNAASQVKGDNDLHEAVYNAKKAVENFAGHYSLDGMLSLMKELSNKADSDDHLQKIMHSNYQFILNAFRDKKFIHDDNFNEKAIERFNTSRQYLLKAYGEPIKQILSEGTNFVTALKEDPTTNRAISDLESFSRELFLDESGRPTIKYDLLQDFHKFVPVLAKRLKKLNIPRIAEEDDGVQYILDNISLACDNILPRTVRIRTDTEFDNEDDVIKNVVSVKMSGVQASAQDIAFYFKKKILLGNVEDSGIVNVVIDKDGLDVFLKLMPKPIDNSSAPTTIYAADQPNFVVLESKCRVNNISVSFQHAKYDLIYKMFNKAIQSNIKRQIETKVGESIRDFLEGVDSAISSQNKTSLLDKSEKTEKPLDPSPDGWKSDAFSGTK